MQIKVFINATKWNLHADILFQTSYTSLRIIRNSISAISNRDTITVVWDLFIYLEWIKQETMVT